MNIILFGAPGAGKGTQSQYLQQEFGFKSFSMGEALREEVAKKTVLGLKVQKLVEKGQFAGDDVVREILSKRLDQSTSDIIFDGFPRKASQVEMLNQVMIARDFKIDAVIVIDVDEETLIKRITGRYSCQDCGQIYNKFFHQTTVQDVCDVCHSHNFVYRKDDSAETLKERYSTYMNETVPVINDLKLDNNIIHIDGSQSRENIQKKIKEIVSQFS